LELKSEKSLPKFAQSEARNDPSWQVGAIPPRMLDCKLILGDVSPSDTERFKECMKSSVDAVQVDFDDGHCPTWRAQLKGWFNIFEVSRDQNLTHFPAMILRPRAWNMVDHSVLVNGKRVPGPLLDFAILMFHNARILNQAKSGPFLFLSKMESAFEAQIWDKIFGWTEQKLGLTNGTIKACVLIENILAAYEMEEILFALKDHSLGLNCGIWDYSASIINKFGDRPDFIIPDRFIYVNMKRPFLKKYMDLVIQTCHRRGAPATGGMTAQTLPKERPQDWPRILEQVCAGKKTEIEAGVDGFLLYDLNALDALRELWKSTCSSPNQMHVKRTEVQVKPHELVDIPKGEVTLQGLRNNVKVGILFIQTWIQSGKGVFVHDLKVEDSATAEISRSQVWQWIRHGIKIENGILISRKFVYQIVDDFVNQSPELKKAGDVFKRLVVCREFPEFITSYLNEDSSFTEAHEF
jgi:malate synthase A